MKKLLISAAALALLAACSAHVQTTSGADYLSRYNDSPAYGAASSDVDADVKRIAAIEPQLQFPARIGLARIEHGRLAAIPAEEGEVWQELAEALGPEFGEFAPVSPLIAAMVAEPREGFSGSPADVIADIRRGAARQHLDYVLTYEVGTARSERANELAVADLTIIGMWVLPTRGVKVDASASALLLDVRNGYPYATLTGHAEEKGAARAISTSSKIRTLSDKAETRAVVALAEEAENAFTELAARAPAAGAQP